MSEPLFKTEIWVEYGLRNGSIGTCSKHRLRNNTGCETKTTPETWHSGSVLPTVSLLDIQKLIHILLSNQISLSNMIDGVSPTLPRVWRIKRTVQPTFLVTRYITLFSILVQRIYQYCSVRRDDNPVEYARESQMKNFKIVIKIRNTVRLSCKLTTMILMVWRVADRWHYDAGMQHDGAAVV